jgi:hypothetical protein
MIGVSRSSFGTAILRRARPHASPHGVYVDALEHSQENAPDWFHRNLGYAHLMDGNAASANGIFERIKQPSGPMLADIAAANAMAKLPTAQYAGGDAEVSECRDLLRRALSLDPQLTAETMERQAFPAAEIWERYLATLRQLGLK